MKKVQIVTLGDGLYSIIGSFSKDKEIWATAQDMRDISDWCLLHMKELEQEATKMNRRDEQRKAQP